MPKRRKLILPSFVLHALKNELKDRISDCHNRVVWPTHDHFDGFKSAITFDSLLSIVSPLSKSFFAALWIVVLRISGGWDRRAVLGFMRRENGIGGNAGRNEFVLQAS